MPGLEAPARAHLSKPSADARAPRAPQAPIQPAPCPGAAAQLAAVHRTLRHGPALQLQPDGVPADARPAAAPKAAVANRTGLPDRLKAGVEALSGISLDGVKVHYDSSKPAQLNAHAYAQGSDIHVAPGQERHLPHEAWHVVQQAQGRVSPTMQLKNGVPVNDEAGLEREADAMGARAIRMPGSIRHPGSGPGSGAGASILQRRVVDLDPVVIENRNVAVSWRSFIPYAVTPTIINGKEIPPTSNKKGLIKGPEFDLIERKDQDLAHRFKVQLTVPDQTVGYRLELPTDGPWDLGKEVTVEELDSSLRGIVQVPVRTQEEEKKKATLTVMPDGDLKGQIRKHEMHHVGEQEEAVAELLRPWDRKVEDSKAPAEQLVGRDLLELFPKFQDIYNRTGPKETAQEIADALVGLLEKKGNEYHATDEGKDPEITRFELSRDKEPWLYKIWLKLAKV